MEDRYSVEENLIDGWSLFAVYDGHGGSYVSNFLKFHFKDILRDVFKEHGVNPSSIHEAFKKASVQLDTNEAMHCGSTISGVLIKGTDIIFINSGDSRVVMGTSDGKVEFETDDHKPDRPDENSRIEKAGGYVFNFMGTFRVNGNLALSRCMGDLAMYPHVINTPEITQKKLSEGSVVVIGTDGIWDVIDSAEAIDLTVNHSISPSSMIARAASKGSSDNMTVIIMRSHT